MDDQPVILVVDDEEKIRSILQDILTHKHYRVFLARNGDDALRCVHDHPVDLVLLDLVMPGMDGMILLEHLRTFNPLLPVLIISAYGNIPLALQASRLGAVDFVEKPIQIQNLLERIEKFLIYSRKIQGTSLQAEELYRRYGMVGTSAPMRTIYQKIDQLAPSHARVLICGKTGTGKELVAKALHRLSPRAEQSFIKLNCAAIPSELIESELFGYRKGSFTGAYTDRMGKFQIAHQGTFFLDEIGDMNISTQAKLLRVIEEGEIQPIGIPETIHVNVRIIAATNKDLLGEVAAGRFREDLYYRLNVVTIDVPPISDRLEDLPYLVEHFLTLYCEEYNIKKKYFTTQAMEGLMRQTWNGNVREIRNVIEKLVILVQDEVLDLMHVNHFLSQRTLPSDSGLRPSLHDARQQFEREYIFSKLVANRWNVEKTAGELGIERTNLYRKIKALGIQHE